MTNRDSVIVNKHTTSSRTKNGWFLEFQNPSSYFRIHKQSNQPATDAQITKKEPRTSCSSYAPDVSPRGPGNYLSTLDQHTLDSTIRQSVGEKPLQRNQSISQIAIASAQLTAPWMATNFTSLPLPGSDSCRSSPFNSSSDNVAHASPLPTMGLTRSTTPCNMRINYYSNGEGRRHSITSINTLSSQSSVSSISRSVNHKKLKTFFGDDFPARNRSETSLPSSHDKEVPPYSHVQRQRPRAASSVTDSLRQRDISPESPRPKTPVPSRDVVPFLYQDSQDISKYGEAPVRENLSGPDKDRFSENKFLNAPKYQSRSAQQAVLGSKKSSNNSEDNASTSRSRVRGQDLKGAGLWNGLNSNPAKKSISPRNTAMRITEPKNNRNNANNENPVSPSFVSKRGILSRIRRIKERDNGVLRSKEVSNSPWPFNALGPRSENARGLTQSEIAASSGNRNVNLSSPELNPSKSESNSSMNSSQRARKFANLRRGKPKTINKNDTQNENNDNQYPDGLLFDLDTNLNNMEGILVKPLPLIPLHKNTSGKVEDEAESSGSLGWNAPESWAVIRDNDDTMTRLSRLEDPYLYSMDDEKSKPYCIRIFRLDGTFATLSTSLNATVAELMSQLGRKTYLTDTLANYQIIMKKHDLLRILGPGERPVVIQKRLLEQVGYEERDRIEDVGREDNSYLCRFSFIPARESGFATNTADAGISRTQKYSNVNLSGRNLMTIPIALYSRASEITSLNLSRNHSLDLPKDFIQSCQNLREIKFVNNEVWKLPVSLSRAARLTILDFSNNRVEQLDQAELDRLQNLASLKLANNRLVSLPSYFGNFKALRTLNLSSNFLDSFPKFLCELESLVDIDMSFNAIASVPDEIGQLVNLERFVITNNRLNGSLPITFAQLINLKEVDIRYNSLSSIDVISKLPKVDQISADHNSVSVCECEFTKIRVLRLNSNPVTKFEILNLVPTLTTLNLSNAKLAHIPDATFYKMPNLIKLNLDINHFVSLPMHIGKLLKLEHFSIARNALSSLPAEIGCLTELRHFDVRQNNLKKLPIEIWWANKLETFNVSSNVLDTFPMPASRPPQAPDEPHISPRQGSINITNEVNSISSSFEELGALETFGQRRPSQLSNSHHGPNSSSLSGTIDMRSSSVSTYGKRGRQLSVVSKTASEIGNLTSSTPQNKRDLATSSGLTNTFAKSLKNLYLADNQLDDDVFERLILLSELRILNLSYNDLNDIPHRSIKSWPQLTELYLSGNELTTLPSDDFEEFSLLQVLHINGNKFQTLPAELGKAHRLTVLDCSSNSLKYNVSNWPYDWNWNWNTNLRYLSFSGNKRLEIKPSAPGGAGNRDGRDLTNFNALQNLRVLGLMDVTLTIPSIPDQTEDRRVRTSGSLVGQLSYGMADTLGKNEHLSIMDMVVPRFNSCEAETLIGMFDGQALPGSGSKIAKFLHENFGRIFSEEIKKLNSGLGETISDALRRAFLSLNKDLAIAGTQQVEERSLLSHRGSFATVTLNNSDIQSGGVATVLYLQNLELFVANVGDAQAILIHSEGGHRILTRKHDPAEPNERQRIRDAGGWVSRQGKLNEVLEVSRAFGYVHLMPGVQAAPHITQITIKEQDEMILIASRELWEYLPPELVVDVARFDRIDLMRASQRLRDLAIAFGATNKLMVMIIGVSDLKKRLNTRTTRVSNIFMSPGPNIDETYAPLRRPKKKGETVEDSGLRRLQAEVDAPVGDVSIAFTDIKSSTLLWETYPSAMRSAIKLHNEVMRRQLRIIGGYEVKTEGDAFMVSFPTATSALLWCFAVQQALLEVQWPSEVLSSIGQEIYDNDQTLIFKGLSVRMGVHWGHPVCETDPVTRRMDYFGPMVNRAARISAVADGGQITVSADFISEIQRCLETYSENVRSNSGASEENFDNDATSHAIRRELRSLSSQGFEVKDIGERKLKGLENPEYIYLMYPHSLSGRIHYQQRLSEGEKLVAVEGPAKLSDTTQLDIEADSIWELWHVCLRLEMLCSSLEVDKNSQMKLQPPETAILEKFKNRGGEMTDWMLVNFLAHQITRIEACTSSIVTRHLVIGQPPIYSFDQLRDPIGDVLGSVSAQLQELQKYKMRYGELSPKESSN